MKYYIASKGLKNGPYSIEEIIHGVEVGRYTANDFVYDDKSKRWVVLTDFCKPFLNAQMPVKEQLNYNLKIWYYASNNQSVGPYSYNEMIKLMQNKTINQYSLVWKEGDQEWQELLNTNAFSADNIKTYFLSDSKQQNLFIDRKYKRKKLKSRLLLHNNLKLWTGSSVELGKGGVGILMEKDKCNVGDILFVRFQRNSSFAPFNTICEVISTNSTQSENNQLTYNFKFRTISRKSFELLGNLVEGE